MHREHPLRIIRSSIQNIWLLLFPILRSLLTLRTSPEELARWLHGSWFDILILLLILGSGWLRWYCRRFSVRCNAICMEEGLIFRRIRCFPLERISAVTLEYPLWLKPFGGMYVCADTDGGSRKRHDLRLLIRSEDAPLFRSPCPKLRYAHRICGSIQVHPWRVIVFSAVFSSSLSGALYAAAFWFQGGRITGSLISEFALVEQLGAASREAAKHLQGIPPAAAAIAIIILSLWVLSFVNHLLRYGKFTMQTDKSLLFIRSGILVKRSFWLKHGNINFLDIRQSLPTKLCRLYSIAVSCAGYGCQRGTIPVCLPILTEQEMHTLLPLLFRHAALPNNQVKAPLTAWWGFVWAPLTGLAAVLPAAYLLGGIFPKIGDLIGFLRLMLLIPIGWKLLVQLAALLTNGIAAEDHRICVRYCRGFVFHTVLADTSRIVRISLTQFPWQRWFGKCNLVIAFRTERGERCVLKNLDLQKVQELLKEW